MYSRAGAGNDDIIKCERQWDCMIDDATQLLLTPAIRVSFVKSFYNNRLAFKGTAIVIHALEEPAAALPILVHHNVYL